MSAAYSTGTATDPTDLLTKLNTFLTGQGWTSDSFATDGAGKRAHLHKGSDYVNLRSAVNEAIWPNLGGNAFYGIGLYVGTGYNGAVGWAVQAGGPKGSGTSDTVGSSMLLPSGAVTAYHFFDDGSDNIVVVVERSGGLFTHMGFGRTAVKLGTWTGGAYFWAALPAFAGGTATPVMGDANTSAAPPFGITQPFNTNSTTQLGASGFVRVDVDAFTSKWVGASYTGTTGTAGYTGKKAHAAIDYNTAQQLVPADLPGYQRLLTHLVSTFNAQAVLLPIRVYAERDAGGWSPVADVPNVFASYAVESGYAAGSIYTVNGKNYMLFPKLAVRKFA